MGKCFELLNVFLLSEFDVRKYAEDDTEKKWDYSST